MNHTNFVLQLKSHIPSESWVWLISALQQEPLIWTSLEQTDLGRLAIEKLTNHAEKWTPAYLALLSLNEADSADSLKDAPMQPMAYEIEEKALQSFQAWKNAGFPGASSLSEAGLLALALREAHLDGTWDGLAAELSLQPGGDSQSLSLVFACLYGMVPSPAPVIRALLRPGPFSLEPAPVLHAFLCSPLPEHKQVETLQAIFEKLPYGQRMKCLRYLAAQRPSLAAKLAQRMPVKERPAVQHPAENSRTGGDHLDLLAQLINTAEIYQLSARPSQTIPLLAESLRATRSLQAHLAAQLGLAAQKISDSKTALDAWKQAAQLAPESEYYAAELALALVHTGRPADAQAYLAAKQAKSIDNKDPLVTLAAAYAAKNLDDPEQARKHALASFDLFEAEAAKNRGALLEERYERLSDLAHLLFDLDQYSQAVRAAKMYLHYRPNDADLLELIARAQLTLNQPESALSAVQVAAMQRPENDSLRHLLIQTMEAAGEWQAALEERIAELEQGKAASIKNYQDLAYCALSAQQPEVAAQACEKALVINPEDGLLYGLLGRAALLLGDEPAALAHLNKAIELAPGLAEPWLALAEVYQKNGQEAKVIETLRAAVQAAPLAPEAHLALGEAYRSNYALTQALASFRQAAELANQKDVQPKSLSGSGFDIRATRQGIRIALQLGQTLRDLGHTAEARQVLEEANHKAPSDPAVAYAYAKTLLDLDEVAAAVPPLELVVQTQPTTEAPYLEYAEALLETSEGRPEDGRKAVPVLDHVLDRFGKDIEIREKALVLIAKAHALAGSLPEAQEAYRKALETKLAQKPDLRAQLSSGLGSVALELGQHDIAIASLQEAAQLDPQDAKTQRLLSQASYAADLFDDSFRAAKNALNLQPNDLSMLLWFAGHAELLAQRSKGIQSQAKSEAIKALQDAQEMAPSQIDILVPLGRLQLQAGEADAARETFARLAALVQQPDHVFDHPDAVKDLHQGAQCLRRLGEADQSILLLTKAAALHKSRSGEAAAKAAKSISLFDILNDLYEVYLHKGDLSAALQTLDEEIALQPGSVNLHLDKAELLQLLDEPEAALKALGIALEISPDEDETHLRAAHFFQAHGDLPSALAHAERALALHGPNRGDALYQAAEIAYTMLLPEKALQLLADQNTPDEDLPNRFELACLTAEAAFELGDREAATAALAAAVELKPNHARHLANQAHLAALNGDAPSALQMLETALAPDAADGKSRALESDLATLRSLGAASMDLSFWDQAFSALEQVIEFSPYEPLSHLHMVQALVKRAEEQRLCQELDAVRHAPGDSALSEEAFQLFEDHTHSLETLLKQPADLSAGRTAYGKSQLARWQARGQAAFHPSLPYANTLEEVCQHPDDAAALVSVYRTLGEYTLGVKAAQSNLDDPYVLAYLALIQLKTEPQQALSTSRQALERGIQVPAPHPQRTPLLHALHARMAYYLGQVEADREAAIAAIHDALSFWDNEPRWHALAAEIYLHLEGKPGPEDVQNALAHLEKATQLEPDHAAHFLALGKTQQLTGELERSIQTLEHAARTAPEEAEAWLSLAAAQRQAGWLNKAAKSAQCAIERSTDPVQALLLRGDISLEASDAQDALKRAESVLRLEPDHPAALHLQARAYKALHRPAEALAALGKAIPMVDEPLSLLLEHADLMRLTKGKKPYLDSLHALAEHYPEESIVLAPLADALMEAGRQDEAVEKARWALHVGADDLSEKEQARLHFLIGSKLRSSGQLDQAIHHLTEAIHLDPDNVDHYIELGQTHQERRQNSQALNVYQQAIGVDSNDYRPYYRAGLVLKESKDYLGSESMLRKAAQLAPDDVSVHRLLGAVVALNLVHNRRYTP